MLDDVAVISALDLAVDQERSFSFSDRGCDRRMLGLIPRTLAGAQALAAAAETLGFDAETLRAFGGLIPQSDAFGLALGRESRSARIYLQFWDRLAARVETGDLRPDLLYLGLKRHDGADVRSDPYVCYPLAEPSAFLPPLVEALVRLGLDPAALQRFLAPLTAQTAIFCRTETKMRLSSLVTLRKAGLDPALLQDALATCPDRDGMADLRQALQAGDLLHLAWGHDQTKGDFVTFYTRCDKPAALALARQCLDRIGGPAGARAS